MPTGKGHYGSFMNRDDFPEPKDLLFFPSFFNYQEQSVLLACSLNRLDTTGTRRARQKRKHFLASICREECNGASSVMDNFLPDDMYEFEEVAHSYARPWATIQIKMTFYFQGHYDGVIKKYREMHLTSWGEDYPLVHPILDRLRPLIPDAATQTHLLHLGSEGEIFPHIDNIHASGSWILGVSLGAERVMRLQSTMNEKDAFDLILPSGSVYVQQ